MDHGVEFGALEEGEQLVLLEQIDLHKLESLSGELLHALERGHRGVEEVVHHDYLVPRLEHLEARVRANVAGAAGDQDLHVGDFGVITVG